MKLKKAKGEYARIIYHIRQLQRALNHAHEVKVLQYEDYKTESPCATLTELEARVENTCKEALFKAIDEEVNSEYWAKVRR